MSRRSFLVPLGAALAAVSVAAGPAAAAQAAGSSRKSDYSGNAMQLLALPLFDALPGWRFSHSSHASHASHSSHVSSVNVGPPPNVPPVIVPEATSSVPVPAAPTVVNPIDTSASGTSTAAAPPSVTPLSSVPAQPAKSSKHITAVAGVIVLVLAALGGGIFIGRIRRRAV